MSTRMATARNPQSNRQARHKPLFMAAEDNITGLVSVENNLDPLRNTHARTHIHNCTCFWYFCPLDKCPSQAHVLMVLLRTL